MGESPRKRLKSSSKKRSASANKSQSKARQQIQSSNPKNAKYTGEGSGRKRNEIYRYFSDDSARTKQKVDFIEEQEWEDMLNKRSEFDSTIGDGLKSVLESQKDKSELLESEFDQSTVMVIDA